MDKSLSSVASVKVVRVDFREGKKSEVLDEVAVEVPVNIFVSGDHFVTLLALPEFMNWG
jgi:formate dehydrogenase assembly factor FdhD